MEKLFIIFLCLESSAYFSNLYFQYKQLQRGDLKDFYELERKTILLNRQECYEEMLKWRGYSEQLSVKLESLQNSKPAGFD